jgi:drug/metabolite transporter (DMT)-like permease
MLIAIVMGVLAGLIFTCIGVVLKYIASEKLDAQKYFLVNYFFTCILGLIIFCNFDVVFSGEVMSPVKLVIVFGLSGIFNYLGLLFMQKGMTYGHSGVVWAIGQSALIVPFLVGVFIFNQTGTLVQYIGVLSILLGVFIPSLAGRKNSVDGHTGSSHIWFFLSIAALLSCGAAQAFANVPSYWVGWSDNAQLRLSLGAFSSTIICLAVILIQRKKIFPIARKLVVIGFVMSVVMLLNLKMLFYTLDRLSSYNMGAIGYPIVIGSCIAGFSLYSMFVIKEKVLWQNWVGLIATISGIIIISL